MFSFLLSSRIFIPPHELLAKLIESVPENDESLERMVGLVQEWTRVSKKRAGGSENFFRPRCDDFEKTFSAHPPTSHFPAVPVRLPGRGDHVARQTYRRAVRVQVPAGRQHVGDTECLANQTDNSESPRGGHEGEQEAAGRGKPPSPN